MTNNTFTMGAWAWTEALLSIKSCSFDYCEDTFLCMVHHSCPSWLEKVVWLMHSHASSAGGVEVTVAKQGSGLLC